MGKPTFDLLYCGSRLAETLVWSFTTIDHMEVSDPEYNRGLKRTRGTETSQYPEERTSTETPLVVASERGPGQCTGDIKPNELESSPIAGDSPVGVKQLVPRVGRDT